MTLKEKLFYNLHNFFIPESEYGGYSNKQRMFHSPRHSKSHQGTQTDSDLMFSDNTKDLNQSPMIREEFYEEQSLLYDQLLKSEEVRKTHFYFHFSLHKTQNFCYKKFICKNTKYFNR